MMNYYAKFGGSKSDGSHAYARTQKYAKHYLKNISKGET